MLPLRSKRYGVGKEIGGAVYIHRSYEHLLGDDLLRAKEHLPNDFSYTIVKYCAQKGTISFIQCTDFDTSSEPTVGDSLVVYPSGDAKRFAAPFDPYVYHHKWLFVGDEYSGFSVAESIGRSLSWMALGNIDTRRIGKKSYWLREVIPRIRPGDY